MTVMNFALSKGLQDTLTSNGLGNNKVYAYAFAFADVTDPKTGTTTAGSLVGQATLVENGKVGASSIDLGTKFASGGVYVVVQQNGDGKLPASISKVGDVAPNATAKNFQYQLFEATLSGTAFDQGDISALNTFGLPSTYTVSFSDGTSDTRGFKPGLSGDDFYSTLGNAQLFTPNTFPSANRLSIGPATAANAAPFPASDWTAYVTNLGNSAATLNGIKLVVPFAGTPANPALKTPAFDPILSQYGVEYDPSAKTFWLKPDNSNGAQNKDWIEIPVSDLMNNIYVQPGPLKIHVGSKTGPAPSYPVTSFTPNNADGAVAKYFVSGFDAGYWGGSGTSANPKAAGTVDLNKTWNWNFNYAYNATLNDTAIKYTNVLGMGPGTTGGNNRFYDPWAQTMQKNSNAYGYSYTDLVSEGGVNPQITLWDPTAGANVKTITISLFDNSEKLPSTSGYKASGTGYVAPPSGAADYSPVNTAGTSGLGFAFQYGLSTLNFAPDNKTPAVFKFYAPKDTMAGSDGFVSLPIPILQGTIASTKQTETSIWNVLYVKGAPGAWSLDVSPAPVPPPSGTNPYSQQQGYFSVNNVPVTADGTTGWYQLVFGDTSAQTVYNIYARSDTNTHQFLPIVGTGAKADNFVVDHGVGITQATPTLANYTVSLAPGGSMTYDIDTFTPPKTIKGTDAKDTLVGTVSDDSFVAGQDHDVIHGGAGNDTAIHWQASKNFALRTTAAGTTITVQDKVGTDGTDSLTSIENIRFLDQTINAASTVKAAALPAAQILKIVDLYTAGLNRAPDAAGLHYWASSLSDGASINDISKAFFSSAEAAPIYTSSVTTPIFVSMVYATALGRAPDAAGAAYWANELETGNIQRTNFVTALINSARSTTSNAADAQYIANKEAVGGHFALTQGLNNGNSAIAVLSGVNGTVASVTAAHAQTDAFAATAATTAGSELVMQIVGLVP